MDDYAGLVLDDVVLNDLGLIALGSLLLATGAGIGMLLRLTIKKLFHITYG